MLLENTLILWSQVRNTVLSVSIAYIPEHHFGIRVFLPKAKTSRKKNQKNRAH